MTDASPDPAPEPADAGVHTAPDEVWAQVRDDYLAGWSAPACCRRHGVGLSTLRKRAAEEGWRRTDQPWSRPNGLERDDEGLALEEQFDGDLDQIVPRDGRPRGSASAPRRRDAPMTPRGGARR